MALILLYIDQYKHTARSGRGGNRKRIERAATGGNMEGDVRMHLYLQGDVMWGLRTACWRGDLGFVSQCIAEDRDRGQNVDWEWLMQEAYHNKHMDIVRCIRDSGRVSINISQHLTWSCELGDLGFVSQCVDEDRDREQNVDWEELIKTAYDNKHMDIVRCIRDSGRASINTSQLLTWSCELGDMGFVSQCIAEDRDRGQNVNWETLLEKAYNNKHMDIVSCIRDSGRVVLYKQLHHACREGDLEFVSQCVVGGRVKDEGINWEDLIEISYDSNHMDIVAYINANGRAVLHTKLYNACIIGDEQFVSDCMAKKRDHKENVNWKSLMNKAYETHKNIARVIVQGRRCTIADLYINLHEEDKVHFVINNTQDVNVELRPGLTALHVLCHYHTENQNVATYITSMLQTHGLDMNVKGYMGRTPLHIICHGKNEHIRNILRDGNGGQKQESKADKLQPGGEIAGSFSSLVIGQLIDRGASINAIDDNGQTPLHLLCLGEGGYCLTSSDDKDITNIATLLVNGGAMINQQDYEGRTPLAIAAQHGNHAAVSFLCQQPSCNINMATFIGQTPLYLASAYKSANSAKILIKYQADVNQPDDYKVTPLAAACEHNNFEIVSVLLVSSAKLNIPDKEGLTALHKAVKHCSVESCRKLLSTDVSLNEQDITGCTALHLAASCHNIEIVDLLLKAKCCANVENNMGNLPLHIAVSTNNTAAIDKLIECGSNINHQNNYGETPIALCVLCYNLEVVKLLFDKNADINCVDNMHRNLIHKAVESLTTWGERKLKECTAVISSLIEYELAVNTVDVNHQTPLHLAAKIGNLDLVTFLVHNGANVATKDSFKHVPLMSAIENPCIFQYLWSKSIVYMDEDDRCMLQRLSHWLGLDCTEMEQRRKRRKTELSLQIMPQNVRRLTFKCDGRLEKWLRSSNDELPDFMSDWLPSLQPLTYVDHPTINKVIWEFLKDLQDGVKKKKNLVAYAITQCGSVDERTKVFAQDECDCSCVEENILFDMFEIPEKPDHPVWTAFVHLVCKKEYVEKLKSILDNENKLSQGKLCHFFGKTISQVTAEAEFWGKYPQIQRISVKDISAGDRRICTMHVIWSDEICPQLELDIDLAPVIDLHNWKPSWCNKHPLINEIRCIALPKWKITHDVDMDLMEIGVHEWGPLFRKMPEEMRQGYRLAKVVRGSAVCPQIPQAPALEGYKEWSNAGEFMNTYLLKQVIMHEYTAFYDQQQQQGEDPPAHSDLYWARRIYERMEEAFLRLELYSWFIPSYNLLNDDKFVTYQDVAVLYARLCRRLLTEEAAAHFRKAYMGVKGQ